MNIYAMCGFFSAGVLVAGGLAIWWDWKHPKPVRWDWSPERRVKVLEGTYGHTR